MDVGEVEPVEVKRFVDRFTAFWRAKSTYNKDGRQIEDSVNRIESRLSRV